jgi:Acyltransferase
MSEFDDIRPYYDHEVRPTLDRILADPELIQAVTHLTFPKTENWLGWLWRPLVRAKLTSELAPVQNVHGFQQIVEKYMSKMIKSCVKSITVSGLDQLDKTKPYLFISNHRDIAMDPAFINWVLYHNESNTLRIAIGDNLLTKPFASDLMRLNKSFIVNRSAKAPREKLKAAKHLSAYIYHSIVNEHSSIWIAQREGRAKDGCDKTNSAVLGMITLNKPKNESLADYIRSLHLVPVSISYELDPCDAAKARELYLHKTEGSYQKEEHEDVRSIAMGIAGKKGHIHLAFGKEMIADYEDNDQLVAELDQQILNNYVLHATNCFAYEMLFNKIPSVKYSDKQIVYDPSNLIEEKAAFVARIHAIPEAHREIALAIYANPVKSKLVPNAE